MKKITFLFMCLLSGVFTSYSQFSENFDSGTTTPAGWTVINGGDPNTWVFGTPGTGTANSGTNVAKIVYNSTIAHDDYLITPQFTVTLGVSEQLSLWARHRSNTFPEPFDILLSSTGTSAGDFTTTIAAAVTPNTTWQRFTYSLAAYAGQTVYIAFRSTTTDEWELYLDDVVVGAIPNPPDYVNLQWPPTASIAQGGSTTVYGQIYEAGLTDTTTGQAPGVSAWVGISPVGSNTNPNTWTTWIPATFNVEAGNNDEYQATIGATLTPGTYYYATRFILNGGNYYYGGINATAPNNGNFWDGATFGSGVLTVTPPPAPANDECSGAIPLTVNPDANCTSSTAGTILGATSSSQDAAACGGTEDDDVWFSFVATATSHYINLNNIAGSTTDLYHSLWTGADCNSLTLVPNTCSDPNNSTPTGLTIGQTYYVRVYSFTATAGQTSTFNVCISTIPPAPSNDDCIGAVALTVGGVFADNAVTGTTLSATTSSVAIPNCPTTAPSGNADVWYSFTVPASGNVTIETQASTTNPLTDTVVVAFSGTCGSLAPVGCDDDNGTGFFSLINLTGQTPGSTLYIGVWKYGTTAPSATVNGFKISAYDSSLGNNTFDAGNFSYYPNPVKSTLNLSYNQEISNVEIFNLMGQKVSSNAINANQTQVDMSNFATGAYLVKVTSNNQVKTIRVIKE